MFKQIISSFLLIFSHEAPNNTLAAHKNAVNRDFDRAIIQVLAHEGGLGNDKNDRGGITNHGISFRFLKAAIVNDKDLFKRVDLNRNHILDSGDIILMTKKDAEHIYREEWWDKYGYGKITYYPLAAKVFDMAINMGPSRAGILLRRATLSVIPSMSVNNNSYLSEKEIMLINRLENKDKEKIVRNLIYLSTEFYKTLAKNRPSQQKFLKGWLKRAQKTF